MDIKFCTQCGGSVVFILPDKDTHQRHICTQCGFIHYQNPRVITGCLVYKDEKVLLCKRAIEPRFGLWTVPAGFMENGESTRLAAQRETFEEAGVEVVLNRLFVIANLTHANQVYMLYLAELLDDCFHFSCEKSSYESSDVQLFTKEQIPWDNIAFYTVKLALIRFFEDFNNDQFLLHEIDF